MQDCLYNALLSQFDPRFESGSDAREGNFYQMIQCHEAHGAAGNPRDFFIVFGYYSDEGGIGEWEAYGAVPVNL